MASLMWASIALVIYTYAGYPLWLWLAARWLKKPVHKGLETPEVVMIVVGHNEAHRIQAKINTCLAQDYPGRQAARLGGL
jgi:hypothetical protein